jgi:ribosomal protein L24E
VSEDKTKALKKCGWCGKEIKDGNYITIWKKDKLVMIFCKECSKLEDINERIRKIYS